MPAKLICYSSAWIIFRIFLIACWLWQVNKLIINSLWKDYSLLHRRDLLLVSWENGIEYVCHTTDAIHVYREECACGILPLYWRPIVGLRLFSGFWSGCCLIDTSPIVILNFITLPKHLISSFFCWRKQLICINLLLIHLNSLSSVKKIVDLI